MKTSEELFSQQAECSITSSPLPVLDPTWVTVTTLFPGQTGMKILLAILASAVIVQRTLPDCGQVDVAVLHCQNMAAFAQQLRCGKDTLLRYIKLYQALGLLTHTRVRRGEHAATQFYLLLTPYQPSSDALERVNALTLEGRKKQQDLARYVYERYILTYSLPLYIHRETKAEDPVLRILTRASSLLQKKRISRIKRQVLQQEITEVLVHLKGQPQGDLRGNNNSPVSLQHTKQGDQLLLWRDQEAHRGDQMIVEGATEEDLAFKKGDLLVPDVTQPEDLLHERGDLRAGVMLQPGDLTPYQGDFSVLNSNEVPEAGDQGTYQGDFSAQSDIKVVEVGDFQVLDAVPSSIDSLLINDSSQKELELESSSCKQWRGSEEELSQEAIIYLKLLDGPEYATSDCLSTHAGKKALAGYKNKLRRDPSLARIAAVNTLLQRTFYDLTKQKKPLENAGKWFHSSFDRYADQQRPMEITGEILDWAKSPYTLEEIAFVLRRERRRQETQWWPSESPHLPFSPCVVTYQHLRDKASEIRMNVCEGDQDAFTAETARQEVGEAMEPPSAQWMSCDEAEQLADEINHEASWYLDEIQVHPEPRLGEHAYIVEASIAETTFSVVYASRQEWWQDHQQQLKHQTWKEQQKEKKRRTHFSSVADPRIAAM